jgi:hypothetical protein
MSRQCSVFMCRQVLVMLAGHSWEWRGAAVRPAGVDPLIPGLCCVLPWEGLGGMAPSSPAGGQ